MNLNQLRYDFVYPGHPVVIAYFVVSVFPTYDEAFKPTKHNLYCALGDSRIPGAGGCVYSALDVLWMLRKGKPFNEVMAFADETWDNTDNHKNAGGCYAKDKASRDRFLKVWLSGQAQANTLKPELEKLSAWWAK